jgi:hypothetical protein
MKRFPFFLSLLTGAVLGATAYADVSITVNSNGGRELADAQGLGLAYGSLVRVGYFQLGDASVLNVLQNSNDYNQVNNLFTELGEGQTGAGTVSQLDPSGNLLTGNTLIVNDRFSSGEVFGQISGINPTYIATDADLSIWVFNGPTWETSTQWGIYSAWDPAVTSNGWEFPASGGSQTLSTSEASLAVRGEIDNTNQQLRLAEVAPVPEPSGLLLSGVAGCYLLAHRRRSRK